MKAAVVALLVSLLLVNGFRHRWGSWSRREWGLFAVRMTVAVALVVAGLWMGWMVDNGGTQGWSQGARNVWALGLLASALVGVAVGMPTLLAFAWDEAEEDRGNVVRVGLVIVTALIAGIGTAFYLESALAVPLRRSLTMLIGLASLGLGIWTPEWLQNDPRLSWLARSAGPRGVRGLYLGLGALFVAIALFTDGLPFGND